MSKRKPQDKQKKEFDPKMNYTWSPDDEFIVKGNEIDFLNKVIQSILNTPEAAKILAVVQARDILANIFKESYEDGIIKEYIEPKKEESTPTTEAVVKEMSVVKEEQEIEAE
jgi:hypothetical protein